MTQRLLGQQCLGDFVGLHVDIRKVNIENTMKTGVTRKGQVIVNTDRNQTKVERKRKMEENRERYGLSQEVIKRIKLPRSRGGGFLTLEEINSGDFTTLEKINHL